MQERELLVAGAGVLLVASLFACTFYYNFYYLPHQEYVICFRVFEDHWTAPAPDGALNVMSYGVGFMIFDEDPEWENHMDTPFRELDLEDREIYTFHYRETAKRRVYKLIKVEKGGYP